MPYLTCKGTATTLSIATGPDVTINTILGLPFIQQTNMIINTSNQVADLRALDGPSFDIKFWLAKCTVPAIKGRTNFSNTLAQYPNIIWEVHSIVAFYAKKSQPASILFLGKRSCHVNFNSSVVAPAINDNSSTVTIGLSIEPKTFYNMDRFSPFDLPCSV